VEVLVGGDIVSGGGFLRGFDRLFDFTMKLRSMGSFEDPGVGLHIYGNRGLFSFLVLWGQG